MITTKKVRAGRARDRIDRIARDYRPIDNHDCALPIAEDYLSMYLSEGYFVLMRRRLKQQFLISEKLTKTKLVFRSSLRIGMEKQRHLRHYYWTIHPFSNFRFYWEIFMGFIFLTTMSYMPLYGINVLNPLTSSWSNTYYHVLNAVCIVDMIITCFTGYHDKNTETVVLNLKQVFKHYLFGYLVFDFIASMPITHIILFAGKEYNQWYCTINRYVRVVRLFTAIKYMDNLMDIIKLKNHKRILLNRLIVFAIMVEYATYFAFLSNIWIVNRLQLWTINYKIFMKMIYCTLRTLFLIKPHHYGLQTTRIFIIFHQLILLHCGNLLNAFLLAMMLRVYNRTSMVLRKHEHLARQVKEYAKFKELPDSMDKILLQFVDFKFGRRIYDEDLILGTLTPHMKDELFFLYSQKLVENVELFKDMPTSAIKRIAVRLKPEILLPNDVIIQAGYEGSSMYFIIAGIVAVYTINGKEVCHLTDGANFGEIALLMNETRTASIVAADFCELFKLNRKDFQEAIEPFPELKERMVQIARERYTTILSFPSNENEEV
ncbi:potassium/sodium hyperpolarization-activated cyclic nucleotide-gated channel 1-like [Coccinella septempunctata]|uniref:potassium/sodium hyperpolarization-activated cyclic nucleotide-gated channel 1-like n=1 Tax=Coccinella septempunctata TaxID=41139 RepID=UPI001D07630E|nr:potassium/sodium hyperpolarization-activated cyclic nucleotide-gated channel 1-like [Coccinella septempunctata]